MTDQTKSSVADDLVIGARAIANYFGTNERVIYHWADSATLPMMFKIGGRLCLRKSVVIAWLEARENEHSSNFRVGPK